MNKDSLEKANKIQRDITNLKHKIECLDRPDMCCSLFIHQEGFTDGKYYKHPLADKAFEDHKKELKKQLETLQKKFKNI